MCDRTRAPEPPEDVRGRLKDYGQDHVLAFWNDLSPEHRQLLLNDIDSLELPRVDGIIRKSPRSQESLNAAFEPVPEEFVSTVKGRSIEQRERWWTTGLKAILDGKLAVLLLAGGQGTRLGATYPKGCFDIGLPSGKSLFQLQAERILSVQKLASQTACRGKCNLRPIHWYIMTSCFTDDVTRKFFEDHEYFGLTPDQVTFFQQGALPCVSENGKFIMETPYKIAKAPDGNGGVYSALKSFSLLEDMTKRGVHYIDCYSVDNALARVADPIFLGYFTEKGAAAAAKVVLKAYPEEKVGVFVHCRNRSSLCVVEYCEMDPSVACFVDQEHVRLLYCWSNVCLQMFTVDFLNQVAHELEKDCMYHWAKKKVKSIDGFTTGFKLERFIFDALPYAPSTCLFEVLREEEFAPVKDANCFGLDTPENARMMLLRLHTNWVLGAGGVVAGLDSPDTGVEVSPLCSYAGENLEICHGRTFHASCVIDR